MVFTYTTHDIYDFSQPLTYVLSLRPYTEKAKRPLYVHVFLPSVLFLLVTKNVYSKSYTRHAACIYYQCPGGNCLL